jgi:hypothetical protein
MPTPKMRNKKTTKKENKYVFIAYEPMLKPLGKSLGGGFRLTLEIPESEYPQIKDLNDPSLKNYTLVVEITKQE